MKIKNLVTTESLTLLSPMESIETMQEALSYQTMLYSVRECVKEYGLQTVLFDIIDTIHRGGVE